MGRLLNKTFFRFMIGFIYIVTLSLAIVIATTYFSAKLNESETATASPEALPTAL